MKLIRRFLFLSVVLRVATLVGQTVHAAPAAPVGPAKLPVEVVEFADFQCPFCAQQASDLRRLQAEYSERISLTFKNFPLSFHARARAAHRAALAAREQGRFWEMHDLIFAHPQRLADTDLDGYARQLHLDLERFHRDTEVGSEPAVIEQDIAEGKRLGISGTPTLLINGHRLEGVRSYSFLRRLIEAELKGEVWDTADHPMASPPVYVNTSEAPFQGSNLAPVTIVEFSDFQCPFCASALPSLKQLLAQNPNDVRWVFKNFPLNIHADARLAHRAALAAGRQGKFWEMHDLIFQSQRTMKERDLVGFATKLNLDLARFQKDLDDPAIEASIEADVNEGLSLGVAGTPTFIVNGEMISGFSAASLEKLIAGKVSGPVLQGQAVLPDLDLALGPKEAPIKIEWYVDLESPLTAQSAVELQQFLAAHPGTVRLQFRNFPLPNRNSSWLLHEFALAAAAQGRFWSVEALLLADAKPKDKDELKALASQAGLDLGKLWADIGSKKFEPVISSDLKRAKDLGVTGTPTFIVGGRKLEGVMALRAVDWSQYSAATAAQY